ncbi:MAG: GNAT family N-acetyltransferase [Planctomycetota bacterium]
MEVLEIREEPISSLATYGEVSIAFSTETVLDVTDTTDDFALTERPLDAPFAKDYDAFPAEHPSNLAARFDLTNAGVLAALRDGRRVGGAIVLYDTPGVDLLEGRTDLVLLLDLRVDTSERGRDVGTALFRAAEDWGRAHGCRELKVETQNVNVAACRFYERVGCRLGKVNRGVYREFPDEDQLLWFRDLVLP